MSSVPSHAFATLSRWKYTQEMPRCTTYGETGLGRTAAPRRRVSGFLKRYWDAFQERRKRQQLRATLSDLSGWELMDIGITRGEIDYVASNRDIDPRGARSAPTVAGQIGPTDVR